MLVVKEPLTEEVHRVYQTWKQPPVAFVAEIGSHDPLRGCPAFRKDEGPKVEIYRDLIRAGEYLYADPPKGDRRLWRLGVTGYEAIAPEANGRLRSAELGLEFGLDEAGRLQVYTLAGERLLTHRETEEARRRETAEAQRADAEARAADLERQLAELRAWLGEG